MTQPEVKNLAASVKARLANLARTQKEALQGLLSRHDASEYALMTCHAK